MLKKYLISYFLLIVLLVGTIGVILNYNISSNVETEISASNMNQLINTSSIIEKSMLTPAKHLVYLTAASDQMQNLDPNVPWDCLLIYQFLKEQTKSLPFIESLNVFFPANQTIISSSGIRYSLENYDNSSLLESIASNSNPKQLWYKPQFSEPSLNSQNSVQKKSVLTFLYASSNFNSPMFYVFVNVYEDQLREVLDNLSKHQNHSALVVNSSNEVISRIDKGSQIYRIENILSMNENGGRKVSDSIRIQTVNEGRIVFSRYYSSENELYYDLITPIDVFFETTNLIKRLIIYVCAGTVLIGALISFLISKRLYMPLRQLLLNLGGSVSETSRARNEYAWIAEKVSLFHSTISVMKSKVNKSLLIDYIKGSGSGCDEKEMNELLPYDCSAVLALTLDSVPGSQDFSCEDIEQMVTGLNKCHVWAENHTQYIVIFNFQEFGPTSDGWLQILLPKLKAAIPVPFKAGIGTVVNEPHELNRSYYEAANAFKYSFLKPEESIFHYTDIAELQDISGFASLADLTEAVESRNKESIELYFSSLSDLLRSSLFRVDSIEKVIFEWIGTLTNQLPSTYMEQNFLSYHSMYKQFYEKANIFEALQWLKGITTNALFFPSEENNKQEIVQHIKAYIDSNYSQDISLELFSSMFFVSPSYISILFKNVYNIGLSNYVSNVRLQKAKELLENKFIKIEEIANQVGMHNYSYFTTKFKAKYGVSPNQYRTAVKSATVEKLIGDST